MYYFQYIFFQNYITYKLPHLIPLSKQGLVWLTAKNHDTGGSNGGGKSIIFMFLHTIFYDGASDEIMYGDKNYLGEVCFIKDKKRIQIFQFRKLDKTEKKKLADRLKISEKAFKPSGYLIFIDGKNRTKKSIPENQKFIKQLFTLTEDEFSGIVHVTPDKGHTLLNGKPNQRREYFENSFSILSDYNFAQAKLKEKLDKYKEKFRNLELVAAEVNTYKEQLVELKERDVLEGMILNIEKKYDSIAEERKDLKNKIEDIDEKRSLNKRRKEILEDLEEIPEVTEEEYSKSLIIKEQNEFKLEKLNTKKYKVVQKQELLEELAEVKKNLKIKRLSSDFDYEKELETKKSEVLSIVVKEESSEKLLTKFKKIDSKLCPTCSQPVSKSFVKENVGKLEKELEEFSKTKTKLEREIKDLKSSIKEIQRFRDLKKQLKKLDGVEGTVADLENTISKLRKENVEHSSLITDFTSRLNIEKQLKKYPEQKIPSKEFYLKLKERYSNIDSEFELIVKEKTEYEVQLSQVKSLSKKIKNSEEKLKDFDRVKKYKKIYEGLYAAYGAKGLKMKQITKLSQRLVDYLPKYTSLMFQEKIKFTTNTKKDNFDIIYHRTHKGKTKVADIKRLSNGEKKRFIPSLMLAQNAIMPLSKKTNLFIADELDANLDSIAKRSFVDNLVPYLKEQFETVIIIAHSKDMKPPNPKEWLVEKRQGESTLKIDSVK